MNISELVYFDKSRYFQGAVQADWFYDQKKMPDIANSYVFHGPKYYGVSESDVSLGQHRLIDTASFAKNLTEKVYTPHPDNCFLMTIAGYGTGKSHLAVSLGGLYAGSPELRQTITQNIRIADADCGAYIAQKNTKQNLVLVLNGMNNFNLDAEVLRQTKTMLKQHGFGDEVLQSLTKTYDIAAYFVENMFPLSQLQFEQAARKAGVLQKGDALKSYLLSKLKTDNTVLGIINTVYTALNGDGLHWERGLSAGDILTQVNETLCGEGKPFHKIILLFDEFGRYIEYAASQPTIAGEAALQQIFEAVQGAHGNILFVGFIQSELDAYLSRIEKTSNIIRYVGRYKAGENLFLSSNFETILANLIQKKDAAAHERILEHSLSYYPKRYTKLHASLNRWTEKSLSKSVWRDESLFKSVIIKGTYPLHPITVWLLSNMHQWMQQRSALTFVSEMLERQKNHSLDSAWLPFVYAEDIIDSGIYNELLNAEEKGLVPSQFCMLYRDILVKIGNKLTSDEARVLKGILILNIARFTFRERADALYALHECVNIEKDDLSIALRNLENNHGVITFDENANTFDFLAEASGFNEFKRLYGRYRLGVTAQISDCDEMLLTTLGLTRPIETSFAQQRSICSTEWSFTQTLINSSELTKMYFTSLIYRLSSNTGGDTSRGQFIYAYCSQDSQSEISRLAALYRECRLAQHPIHILFLDDHDGAILASLIIKSTIGKFSQADRSRFEKHASDQIRKQNKEIEKVFRSLVGQRLYIGETSVVHSEKRLSALCADTFSSLYSKAPPFMFDGFEKKSNVQAKKYFITICTKLFDRTLMNVQSYQAMTQDEKNRVKAVLSKNADTSWQVFDGKCRLTTPENTYLNTLYENVNAQLSEQSPKPINELFGTFTDVPYGMNDYALMLFVFYFIAQQGQEVLSFYGQERLTSMHLSSYIFKQGKINTQEILKIRLQKNPYVNIDLVERKCQELLTETSVESCELLLDQLVKLTEQEGISSQAQLVHAEAVDALKAGMRLYKKIYSRHEKISEAIATAQQKFTPHRFVSTFNLLTPCEGIIEAGYPFVYSKAYQTQQAKLTQTVKKLLEANYLPCLEKLSCSITQISQLESSYKKVITILSENGYTSYAEATETRIEAVIAEAKAKDQYKTSIVEFEKDFTLYGNITTFNDKQCQDAEDKFDRWQAFFKETNTLPETTTAPIFKKIEQVTAAISKKRTDANNRIKALLLNITSAQTVEALKRAQQTLSNEFDEAPKAYQTKIADVFYAASEALAYLEIAPDSLDDLRAVIKHPLPSTLGELTPFVLNELRAKEQLLSQKEKVWLFSYGNLTDEAITDMQITACSRWLRETSVCPGYLSREALIEHQQTVPKVEKRLRDSRVQGVVALFNDLTPEEKHLCLIQLDRNKK